MVDAVNDSFVGLFFPIFKQPTLLRMVDAVNDTFIGIFFQYPSSRRCFEWSML